MPDKDSDKADLLFFVVFACAFCSVLAYPFCVLLRVAPGSHPKL